MGIAKQNNALADLKARVNKRAEADGNYWNEVLPTLRAKSSASAVVLTDLATPSVVAQHGRPAVDVLLAAPNKAWADKIIESLTSALPGLNVFRSAPGEQLPSAPAPIGYTIRLMAELPGVSRQATTERLVGALASIDGVDVDYSEPLELLVLSPSL